MGVYTEACIECQVSAICGGLNIKIPTQSEFVCLSVCFSVCVSIYTDMWTLVCVVVYYMTETPMAYLARQPQFTQLRQVLQNNPTLLQPILQQIGQSNPRLLQVKFQFLYLFSWCMQHNPLVRLLVKIRRHFFSYWTILSKQCNSKV